MTTHCLVLAQYYLRFVSYIFPSKKFCGVLQSEGLRTGGVVCWLTDYKRLQYDLYMNPLMIEERWYSCLHSKRVDITANCFGLCRCYSLCLSLLFYFWMLVATEYSFICKMLLIMTSLNHYSVWTELISIYLISLMNRLDTFGQKTLLCLQGQTG